MASLDHAQLSALASGVEDLARRAGALAGELEQGLTQEASAALYEAERTLVMAGRAVERARRSMGAT
ncbi:MAG: hypothetical protein ABIP03_13345 [Aquihabitans sp.]